MALLIPAQSEINEAVDTIGIVVWVHLRGVFNGWFVAALQSGILGGQFKTYRVLKLSTIQIGGMM